MIIPINIASSSSNNKLPPGLAKISHEEIVLIELQGSLEVEYTHISESDGKLVGKLKIDEATNKPTLLIGHHLLEGKIMTLTKPLAVLHRPSTVLPRRVDGWERDHVPDGMDIYAEGSRASTKNTVGWDVVAVVKRKIIFSKRPMPVVGRATL